MNQPKAGIRSNSRGGGKHRHVSLRVWQWSHRWSSLVCTIFLLVTCITGLPLIFAAEIDHWVMPEAPVAALPAGTPYISLDRIVERSRGLHPGWIVKSISLDDTSPKVTVALAPSWDAAEADPWVVESTTFDRRTAQIIQWPKPYHRRGLSLVDTILVMHMDLFMGLKGKLFMCGMAILFVIAIGSGVVLYAPFTRKLDFGTVRNTRKRRTRWLDLHNLLGVVTLAWATMVGVTGAMNELSAPLFAIWQRTDVRAMIEPWSGKVPLRPDELSSPQAALDTAERALPGMVVTTILYPGNDNGSPHHYLLWAYGKTPLTAQLSTPALVDARTGKLTAIVRMPAYLRALELSLPLHVGDYGGMPLKIIWALLDLVTITVLGSGLYLWFSRRKSPIEARITDLEAFDAKAAPVPTAE